jgi:hypothetical protein
MNAAMTDPAMVCSIAPVEAIVRFSQYFPVFPCRRESEQIEGKSGLEIRKAKSPYTAHGFRDATRDSETIRAWWSPRPWALVGVPTGIDTNLVVLDFDSYKASQDAHDWIAEHTHLLMATRTHTTLGGGRHYLFRPPAGTRYQSGTDLLLDGKVRKGIDLRAEGGYIIWWPLHGGMKLGDIQPLPAGLIDERLMQEHALEELPKFSPSKWQVDEPLVAEALAYLDPHSRDTWRDAGLAIHLASGGSDTGFELWHAWSAGDLTGELPHNYSGINDCRYHWSTFRHDKDRKHTVTLGTLFAKARANGYAGNQKHEPPIRKLTDPVPAAQEGVPRLIAAGFSVSESRIHLDLPYLVKGLFDRGQIIVLWGKPGSGKTFVACHMACHIGAGESWAGHRVKRGRVLYICAESTRARLENRISVLAQTYPQLAESEVIFVPVSVDLLHGEQDIQDVLAAAREMKDIALIVVDTLAVTMGGGDENGPEDMGRYVANIKRIKAETGAAVLIVHHGGKDETRGMRGHSSLVAAIDAELIVELVEAAPGQPTRILKSGKLREGVSNADLFAFELQSSSLGVDPDGDLVTSCVVVPQAAVQGGIRRAPAGSQGKLLMALEQSFKDGSIVWTDRDIREFAKPLMHRNSITKSIVALAELGFIRQSVGGFVLANPPVLKE